MLDEKVFNSNLFDQLERLERIRSLRLLKRNDQKRQGRRIPALFIIS